MQEILGAELDQAFEALGIQAKKTYQAETIHDAYQEMYQVWEISDAEFERLCAVEDDQWNEEWGWWRWAQGSNMEAINRRFKVNGRYIKAWDGPGRENEEAENKKLPVAERWIQPREYSHLTEYFCEELGASTEKNVCALAVDLAKQNRITLSELFRKHQG